MVECQCLVLAVGRRGREWVGQDIGKLAVPARRYGVGLRAGSGRFRPGRRLELGLRLRGYRLQSKWLVRRLWGEVRGWFRPHEGLGAF